MLLHQLRHDAVKGLLTEDHVALSSVAGIEDRREKIKGVRWMVLVTLRSL